MAADGVYGGTWQDPTYTVTVRWGAAPANGSPITGYRVTVSTGNDSTTVTLGPGARSHTFSSSCDRTQDSTCSPGNNGSASVTAVNGEGSGPQASAGASDSGTIPVEPLPAGGAQHVTSHSHRFEGLPVEGGGSTTLSLSPPAGWASFSGTCSYVYSGRDGQQTGSIGCGAASVQVQHRVGYISGPDCRPAQVGNSIRFIASNGQGTVTSATYSWTYQQPTIGPDCPPP